MIADSIESKVVIIENYSQYTRLASMCIQYDILRKTHKESDITFPVYGYIYDATKEMDYVMYFVSAESENYTYRDGFHPITFSQFKKILEETKDKICPSEI